MNWQIMLLGPLLGGLGQPSQQANPASPVVIEAPKSKPKNAKTERSKKPMEIKPSLPEKPQPATAAENKLDANLLKVVQSSRKGGIAQADATAKSLELLDASNLLKIDLTATESAKVPALKQAIEKQKGQILVDLENHIFALVPAQSIESLAALPEVFAIASVANSIRQ